MNLPTEPNNSEQKFQVKKKRNLKVTLLIICALIISALACVWYFNRETLNIYYLNARYNHFKINDNIYVWEGMSPGKGNIDIDLFRMARPINEDDIDALNIEIWKKALAKKELVKGKPYMVHTRWEINGDALDKLKTGVLGAYKGYKIADEYRDGETKTYLFFMLTPNKQALYDTEIDIYKLPKGYTWSDGPFYVLAFQTQDKIPSVYLKK
jgi:hypothetical protein